ncbi:GNAT family N-acetyltransferase [Streptomyces sp. NPDC092903]|uniref:GNAT family N-acetyltransferase n=1 Tax=Streptomyces sp. NPDC092903 TaxID=3366017 RepID=UPI0037F4A14B
MLAMRPAKPEDRPALEIMIQARSEWMKHNQLSNWGSWGKHVQELASNCMRPHGEMWVVAEDHDRILGCTTISRSAAPWAWTASEADDSAFYLTGTVTDPAERHRKLGTLIADWVVDRAARKNISYVRRECTSPALASYYEKQQFEIVRAVSTPSGRTSYALERKARRVPEVVSWLISGRPAPNPTRKPRTPINARSNVVEAARPLSRSIRESDGAPLPI